MPGTLFFLPMLAFVLVITHELAHFFAARIVGMKVPVFGIGVPLGPHVVLFHRFSTEFRLHLLFFGSYSVIPDLHPVEADVSDVLKSRF